jgi:hypothetical protein
MTAEAVSGVRKNTTAGRKPVTGFGGDGTHLGVEQMLGSPGPSSLDKNLHVAQSTAGASSSRSVELSGTPSLVCWMGGHFYFSLVNSLLLKETGFSAF